MQAAERQRRILARARADGQVEVAKVASELQVAVETVRRDMRLLTDHGLLRRTHGGACPVETAAFETGMSDRAASHVAEKRRIAHAAAGLLGEAEAVFVDEGFTPELVAEALPVREYLTVVTASLPVASALAANAKVLLLGGRLRGRTMGVVDHWAVRMLGELVVDVAFMGTNGVSREHGLTTPDPAVGAVKSQAIKAARRRILVAIHTKFGVATIHRFAEVEDFETIVTDSGLPAAEAHRYAMLGTRVVRA